MSLSYNGISLAYLETESIDYDAVFDPSGTDYLYTRMVINVRAVLAGNVVPALPGETPGTTAARIEHLLMTPRKSLTYVASDNVAMVQVDYGTDVSNGPIPRKCRVTQLLSGSFVVEYVVEAAIITCTGSASKNFLSLRWTETTEYDDRWRATKRRSGLLIVRTGFDPDSLRGLCTPGVPVGFRRQRSEYTEDPTGLRLSFTFTDVQLDRMPPYPATKMGGRQIEVITKNGAARWGDLQLALEAPIGVSKRDLLAAALKVAMSRVYASGVFTTKDGHFMADGSLAESLADDQNRIELSLRWRIRPDKGRTLGTTYTPGGGLDSDESSGLGSSNGRSFPTPELNDDGKNIAAIPFFAWLDTPMPDNIPGRAIGGLTRGTADNLRLVAAALNDPCGQQATISQLDGNRYMGTTPDGSEVELRSGTFPFPDDTQSLYSDPTPGAYDYYELHAIDQQDTGSVLCPSTKKDEPCQEIQVTNELRTVTLEWSAKRTGGPPVIPSAEPTDPNVVYLGGTVGRTQVDVGIDGVSLTYTIAGIYNFGYKNPKIATLSAPIPPWLDMGSSLNDASLVAGVAEWPFPSGSTGNVDPFDADGQSSPEGGTSDLVGGGPPVMP